MFFNIKKVIERLNVCFGQWFNRKNSPSTKQKSTSEDNIGRDKNIYLHYPINQEIFDIHLKTYLALKDYNNVLVTEGGPTREALQKLIKHISDVKIFLKPEDKGWLDEVRSKSLTHIQKLNLLSNYPHFADRPKIAGELEILEKWFSEQISEEKIDQVFRKYLNK